MPRRTELVQQVIDLKAQVAGLQTDLAAATAQRDLSRTQLAATVDALTVATEDRDRLTDANALLLADVAALRMANTALNGELVAARVEVARLQAVIDADPVLVEANLQSQIRAL